MAGNPPGGLPARPSRYRRAGRHFAATCRSRTRRCRCRHPLLERQRSRPRQPPPVCRGALGLLQSRPGAGRERHHAARGSRTGDAAPLGPCRAALGGRHAALGRLGALAAPARRRPHPPGRGPALQRLQSRHPGRHRRAGGDAGQPAAVPRSGRRGPAGPPLCRKRADRPRLRPRDHPPRAAARAEVAAFSDWILALAAG